MATINDHKIISKKSLKYFELFETTLNKDFSNLAVIEKERIGFYLFILENLTTLNEIDELAEIITDTDFNKIIYNKNFDDFGVDAVFLDEEEKTINLFNFKYRTKYKVGTQSINETIISTKFINALVTEELSKLSGKTKEKAKIIIDKIVNSNDEWKLNLFVVSNEDFELEKDVNLINLEKAYGLETFSIGLNKISEFITLRPEPIDAEIIIDNDAIMSFSENSISSSKSYILRLPISEVIRITCSDKNLRNKYNIENITELKDVKLDYSVLFDNVRGLVMKSKYNDNISNTIQKEPTKFFMYNNGLTLTANDIHAEPVSLLKKVRLSIKSIQVLNGGQTLRTIHSFNELDPKNIEEYISNCEILVRIFKTSTDANLNNKIAEYTNSQNSISNIDLKSLRSEQLHLEQYLDEFSIIYSRKSGDTGLKDNANYKYKISMERFGQILFSLNGYPDKASNQKKLIFEKYYNDTFGEDNLIIENSPNQIIKYFEIKKAYESLSDNYEPNDQKIFYILYVEKNTSLEIVDIINKFESLIIKYIPKSNNFVADSRKLIQNQFKEFIDKEFLLK